LENDDEARRRAAWHFLWDVIVRERNGVLLAVAGGLLWQASAITVPLIAVSVGRTVITIAHRLSTAERADRVAVIEGGRLVELATHDELVANGDRYAQLWASWEAGTRAA
jgi:ABC-type multidrug transport system fused ATPase/permease subunit